MPIETLDTHQHRNAWLGLMQRSPHSSAHLHPDVVSSTVEHGLVHHQWQADSALSSLAVLAPKSVRVFKMRGFGRAGALSGYRVVADGLLGDSRPDTTATFLRECVALLESGRADCIAFEDLDASSTMWATAHRIGEESRVRVVAPHGVQPHWWIEFPEPPEDYWKAFSSKTRNTFKRKCKKLPHRMVRIEHPDEVERFLAAAHTISRNTWQSRRLGLRVRNDDRERAFFERLAAAGALRSYLLEHEDGRPLAFMVGIQHGSVFVYEEVGYDTEYARLSPGTVLLYRVLTDLHDVRPVSLFDFGTGHADYKELFGNRRTMSGPLLLVANRWRPAMAVRLEGARRAVDQGARAMLRRTRLYERVRRRYRA